MKTLSKDIPEVDSPQKESICSANPQADNSTEPKKFELPATSQSRLDRYEQFALFQKKADTIFKNLRDQDKSAEIYENMYMLSVCPGGRMGGLREDEIEVFWGIRPYANALNERSRKAGQFKFLIESGASMIFFKDSKGFVKILLRPAFTDQESDDKYQKETEK